ncbi:hypothetical protein QBC39DRAFT_8629 [Podospora conica]|nr:hypothetical protein QBC39DRAFT_8629 [Schizothecium conicum]
MSTAEQEAIAMVFGSLMPTFAPQSMARAVAAFLVTLLCLAFAFFFYPLNSIFTSETSTTSGVPSPMLQPAELRRVSSAILQLGEEYVANVVCVQELRGKQRPCTWLNDYISRPESKKIQVIEFQYQWPHTQHEVLPGLISRGDELVASLCKSDNDFGLDQRPLVLVGHGLGGVIVKKAATKIVWENPNGPNPQNRLSGIVFLGTPHTTKHGKERWRSLTLLLHHCFQLSRQAMSQAELKYDLVADISEQFEEKVHDIPVLSVFETKETKTRTAWIFGSKKQLLVGKELARTSVNQEILISSNSDHDDVCTLEPRSELWKEFTNLIDNIIVQESDRQTSISGGTYFTPPSVSWPASSDLGDWEVPGHTGSFASSDNELADRIAAVDLSGMAYRPKLPCHSVTTMSPVSIFVGRDEDLKRLDEKLLPSPENGGLSGLRSFALCGIGGVGKSELASQFLATRQHLFDATFFISATTGVKMDEAFSGIAVDLQLLTPSQAKDRLAAKTAVLNWLSNPYKTPPDSSAEQQGDESNQSLLARWLIVFDNVESATLLKEYTPLAGPGSVLFTSRDPFAKHYLSPQSGMDLLPPGIEDAAALLQRLTYTASSPQELEVASRLVKRLDCLPIAILHVAGVIESQDLTFEEALSRYEKDLTILKDAEQAMAIGTYAQTLPTVWALDGLPPPALALLQVLALLDHDRIRESMLKNDAAHHLVESFPLAADFDEVRPTLGKSSLVSRNKNTKTLSVHHVVQDVTRQKMSKEEFGNSFRAAVALLVEDWQFDRNNSFGHRLDDWQVAVNVVPHISRLVAHFRVHNPALTLDSLKSFAILVTRTSIYLKERGNWDQSLSNAELALKILVEHKSEMAEEYCDILMCLSSTYHCLGDREKGLYFATTYFKERMLVQEAKPAAERHELFTVMVYTELALGRLMNEDYNHAITLALEGRRIAEERMPSTYWPHWADYHHAWSLIGLGRAEEARPILDRMLQWRQQNLENHETESMKTAYTLQIRGVVNEKAGKIDAAIADWELSLYLYCMTEGDSSFRTNQVRVKLGEYYGKQGKPETASIMFETALQSFTGIKYYKGERARTFFKQAQFFDLIGNTTGAAEAMQKAASILLQIRPDLARNRSRLLTLEDFDQAVMIMSR